MNCLTLKIQKIATKYILLGLMLLILLALISGLQLGYITISFDNIIRVFLYKIFGISDTAIDSRIVDIVWVLRLPRLLLAGCVGMGLTLSGIIMQAVVQNPLADPYILGISSGAALGATSAIFLGVGAVLGPQSVGVCAFAGALAVSIMVVILSSSGTNQNAVKLLLTGMAIGAVCSSMSSFIVYMGSSKQGMEAVTYWLMGSVANARLENSIVLLAVIVVGLYYFSTQTRILNLMLVGKETATTLGIDLDNHVKKYLFINAFIVGFIVFNAGTVGFIGLLIPHALRTIYGANHKKMLPIAVLFGGFISIVLDIFSRTLIKGVDIPLGVIFAMMGAPCFIYLMVQRKYRFGGN